LSEASSARRLLGLLDLFSPQHPVWTVGRMARGAKLSVSTTYRYVRDLTEVGLLAPAGAAGYVLGPAIIEYDRQIRQSDPLLKSAVPVARWLLKQAAPKGAVVISRWYRDRVMCLHQESGGVHPLAASYERGLPMSLFRGATSKIILAFLPDRLLRRLFDARRREAVAAGLGGDWTQFRRSLRALRDAGVCETASEVAPGRIGIAAPIFSDGRVLGSLSVVLGRRALTAPVSARIRALVVAAAAEVSAAMDSAAQVRSAKKRPRHRQSL
jgi:DNA-binding IclR family transcriptional regulator